MIIDVRREIVKQTLDVLDDLTQKMNTHVLFKQFWGPSIPLVVAKQYRTQIREPVGEGLGLCLVPVSCLFAHLQGCVYAGLASKAMRAVDRALSNRDTVVSPRVKGNLQDTCIFDGTDAGFPEFPADCLNKIKT